MKITALPLPSLGNIVVFGAALRLLLLVYALFAPEIVVDGDSPEFLGLARNLLETGAYGADTERPLPPDSIHPPLYPAFLALFLLLGDGTPFLALLAQVLLATGNIWLTHRLARQLGADDSVARLAAAVLAIDVSSLIYASTLMAETLFTSLLLIFASILARSTKIADRRNVVALAVLSTGLILTRPVALGLPLVSAALLLWLARERAVRKFLAAAGYVALVVILLMPWALRNARKHDYFGISTARSFSLLYENGVLAKARADGSSIDAAEQALTAVLHRHLAPDSASTGEQACAMQRMGVQTIFDHFGSYALLHGRGMLTMLIDPGRINLARIFYSEPTQPGLLAAFSTKGIAGAVALLLRQRPALLIAFVLLLVWQIVLLGFAVLGGVASFSLRRPLLFWLLFAVILYFLAVTGPLGAARFRVPIDPFLAIFAALGVARMQQKIFP